MRSEHKGSTGKKRNHAQTQLDEVTQDVGEQKPREDDLTALNRAMVGREKRIIQLKREINEQCQALGEEPRYRLEYEGESEEDENAVQQSSEGSESGSRPLNARDLFFIQSLQKSLEIFSDMAGIPSAVLDLEGNVLAQAQWQRICTDFHRVNAETCQRCLESDTGLANQLADGEKHALYRCRNGLVDGASPVFVQGQHVANTFIGQFFTSPPDEEEFRARAREYKFDEEEYIRALREVPVVAEEQMPRLLNLLTGLAQLSAVMGQERLKSQRLTASLEQQRDELSEQRQAALSLMDDALRAEESLAKANEELERNNRELDRRVAERTSDLEHQSTVLNAINQVFHEALTCEEEEDLARTCLRLAGELTGSAFGIVGEIDAEGTLDIIAFSNPDEGVDGVPQPYTAVGVNNMPVQGVWERIIAGGQSEIINDPAECLDRVGMPAECPLLTCFLGVPLIRAGKVVGMIALVNKNGGYTDLDRTAVEALAVPFYETLLWERADVALRRQNAIEAAQAEMARIVRGDQDEESLCQGIATFVCTALGCQTGLMYVASDDGTLHFRAGYAYRRAPQMPDFYKPGEGLVGQAALDRQPHILEDLPDDYITIGSGLGEMPPRFICVMPVIYMESVIGVLEFGAMQAFSAEQMALLNGLLEDVAVVVVSSRARERERALLTETQNQAEKLQAQQEELRVANEELEEQTRRLRESEQELQAQQEKLEVTNEELEEKNELLERQKQDVERARNEVQRKADELALESRYKSEFLANMSHELRTPLNSLLLLAQDLGNNRDGNLTPDQIEAAQVIHSSGSDLLSLINEILDLARIEAGRMEVQFSAVSMAELGAGIERGFRRVADEKGLSFTVTVCDEAPLEITTDRKRLEQVIRNLVSNAVKFTESGGVTVTFRSERLRGATALAIDVSDTGIGIAPEKHRQIFEAFRQADGSTSRRYGGSGLGLSISRELIALLGGEIRLKSSPGEGATFTVCVPVDSAGQGVVHETRSAETPAATSPGVLVSQPEPVVSIHPSVVGRSPAVPDDRNTITDSDTVVLVVEDDPAFAKILGNTCHERGLKFLLAGTGEDGLALAGEYLPDGIILDVRLPGLDGWQVLTMLKEDMRTRHIPVHMISVEEGGTESLRRGAIGHATKPISQEELERAFEHLERTAAEHTRRVLLVEDNADIRQSVVRLINGGDIELDEATTGQEAIEAIRGNTYGCIILDLGLPDMDGAELLAQAEQEGLELPPIIVHTARDLTEKEEMNLREYAESIVIKDVRSQERLLDETSLFLHQMVSRMPEKKRQVIRNLHETDALLKDKRILVVDDDMRTTFAVSRFLAQRGMVPIKAGNGEQALAILEREPEVNLVLMDIMMPVMDGYETMRRIRAQERFRKLPIIALTAKAMPQDRQACIEAGANDYLPKPMDHERLISLMRVWLYR